MSVNGAWHSHPSEWWPSPFTPAGARPSTRGLAEITAARGTGGLGDLLCDIGLSLPSKASALLSVQWEVGAEVAASEVPCGCI